MQKYYKVRSLPYPGLLHSFTFIAASLDLQANVAEVIKFSNKEWKKFCLRMQVEEGPVGLGRAVHWLSVLAHKNSFSNKFLFVSEILPRLCLLKNTAD